MTLLPDPTGRATRRRAAYTLFEIMLVMAFIVILLSFAVPLLLTNLHGDTKLDAAADMVRARWSDCRTQAIEEARAYRFAVIPNTGKFKIEPFDPDNPDNPIHT